MVGQAEQLRQLAIVNASQSTVLSEQFLKNDESADFVVIDSEQDQPTEEVHALAVADLGAVLRIGSKHVVQWVLS